MRWWQMHPLAWQETTRNQTESKTAMQAWADWVESRPGTPVFATHPLSFDGAWINWCLQKFTDRRLFYRPRDPGLSYGAGVDIPSLIMAKTGWEYQRCNRDSYPATPLGGHDHNHRALDDSRGYAHLLTMVLTGNIHRFAPRPPRVLATWHLRIPSTRPSPAYNYPHLSVAAISVPRRMSVSRVRPRQTVVFPGGGSDVLAR